MTTIIRLGARISLEDDPPPVRVTESVVEIVAAVNAAKRAGAPFIAAHNAEDGKEISVEAERVVDISEE